MKRRDNYHALMEDPNGGSQSFVRDPQEKLLWHGTRKSDPYLVALSGIDVRASGNGRVFGAERFGYSLKNYAHRHDSSRTRLKIGSEIRVPSKNGEFRSVLLCRFLTGQSDKDFYQGSYFKKKKNTESEGGYVFPDSGYPDSGYNPNLKAYSVYSNEQVYANFIVTLSA